MVGKREGHWTGVKASVWITKGRSRSEIGVVGNVFAGERGRDADVKQKEEKGGKGRAKRKAG